MVVGRRAERSARRGLVDWPTVERIAVSRSARAPGALTRAEIDAAGPAYEAAMARIVPALSAALGTELPGVVERSGVVDRAGWVRANTATFASLIGKLEADLLDQIVPKDGNLVAASMALANRWITSRQLGYLLGFLGQRVLGQYDVALLSAEQAPGRLLFVEENVRQTAHVLGVPLDPFRTWIALHETTHAFEFEAHPWLRPYLASRLERQLALFGGDARGLGRDAMRGHAPGAARRVGRQPLAGAADGRGAADPLPRDAGGDEPARGVQRLRHGRGRPRPGARRRADQRALPRAPRAADRPSSARCFKLTGMDLKLEQYKKGERFVRAIADARGPDALVKLWEGPESLPRDGEIDAPERWIERVLGAA